MAPRARPVGGRELRRRRAASIQRPFPDKDTLIMTPAERAAVQAHLRRLFGNNRIAVTAPERKGGSTELKVGDEFIGTIHRDAEDGEVSYAVQIVVLSEDLEKPN
jgi:hypothetical protein